MEKGLLMNKIVKNLAIALLIKALITMPVFADEGMWTFDNIPVKKINEKYGFKPSQKWLDNVRLASIRFNDGGSGAFISKTGLCITNHHVALKQLQKMSSAEKDYVKDGFYAKTQDMEIKCPDTELNVLVGMENVTDKILNAGKNLSGGDYIEALRKKRAEIEKESKEKTGLKSDVVSLYQGGEYWLYIYKAYRDVRLVMAPEKQVASFGGKWDNFTYPRYDLDFAIFRIYENGKPIKSENYFRINPDANTENELIFVAGHPGTTRRGIAYSQFVLNRDYIYPSNLNRFDEYLSALYEYASKGAEERRRATSVIASIENSKKVTEGEFKALSNDKFGNEFKAREDDFRKKSEKDAKLQKELEESFENVSKGCRNYENGFKEYTYIPFSYYSSRNSRNTIHANNRLPIIAKEIVRYVTEIKKPDGERLDGYHDSQIDNFLYTILSPEPIYKDLEKIMLATSFSISQKQLGNGHEEIKAILEGKTPTQKANELIEGTKLEDVSCRKQLLDGGIEALKKNNDPLIQLALKTDERDRKNTKLFDANVQGLINPSISKIALAKFKIYGKDLYPDATFTLRLTYGKIKKYEMNGTLAPAFTTLYGMFDRYHSFKTSGLTDWDLPLRYLDCEKKLDLTAKTNCVYETDTIGGNSGSPVFNKNLELIGVNFDRNQEGLSRQFIYDGTNARSVAVHISVIIETLKKIYGAENLVNELLEK